ncbi:MAG: hypothetical protein U0804_24070 [Gemmataceae bacterium]
MRNRIFGGVLAALILTVGFASSSSASSSFASPVSQGKQWCCYASKHCCVIRNPCCRMN